MTIIFLNCPEELNNQNTEPFSELMQLLPHFNRGFSAGGQARKCLLSAYSLGHGLMCDMVLDCGPPSKSLSCSVMMNSSENLRHL